MRHLAQAGNRYSLSWLWIPGSRFASPGMTITERLLLLPDPTFRARLQPLDVLAMGVEQQQRQHGE